VELIPQFVGELWGRLIENFEENLARAILAVLGDCGPTGKEGLFLALGIGGDFEVVVVIEDNQQVVRQGLVDGPVEGSEKLFAHLAVGVGLAVAQRVQVDPDMVEAGLADELEVLLLEATA
jgi:hypothetical protein